MIVKNRRRVDFYTHVVATTPEDSSSRRRNWRYGESSFPSMRTASFCGFFTSGRRSRGRRRELLKLSNVQFFFTPRFTAEDCTAPEMIPNPEMIPKLISKWSPFLFLSTPKWSPRNYGMVIKHGTVDYFFFICRNAAILSFLVSNKRKLVVRSLSRSSLAPVSFQLTFDPFSMMQCFEPRGF